VVAVKGEYLNKGMLFYNQTSAARHRHIHSLTQIHVRAAAVRVKRFMDVKHSTNVTSNHNNIYVLSNHNNIYVLSI